MPSFCLNEIAYVESNRIPIIAIRVETFTPPEKVSQYIHMVVYGLGQGDGTGNEVQLKRVLQAIDQ